MEISTNYDFDNSYVEVSVYLPDVVREIGDPVFRFNATYYIEKKTSSVADEDMEYEYVPALSMIGHTGDFENDYIYTTDAISESTIECYAFAKGLYERLFDTSFEEKLFGRTGQVLNRWVTFESIFIEEEIRNCSEDFQATAFGDFLTKFKETWQSLFYNDVTLVSFSERLYVSPEKEAQKKVKEAYQNANFFTTLRKQKLIEDSNLYTGLDVTLKEIFEMDSKDNLFSEEIKTDKSKHYSGFIYNE